MICKMVLTSSRKMRSRGDLRAGGDVHPSSEGLGPNPGNWDMRNCTRSVCPASLLPVSGQHGPAHNEASPSCSRTHRDCAYQQHTRASQAPELESGIRFGFFIPLLCVTLFIYPKSTYKSFPPCHLPGHPRWITHITVFAEGLDAPPQSCHVFCLG